MILNILAFGFSMVALVLAVEHENWALAVAMFALVIANVFVTLES